MSVEDGQYVRSRSVLNTPRFDVENAAVMRAVKFIVEDDGILKRILSILVLERLLVGAAGIKSIQLVFVPQDHDFPLLPSVVLNRNYLSLPLQQLLALAYLHRPEILHVLF